MSRALTYVEIDVPAWTQTSPDSPETELTLRFAVDTDYLPSSIPAIASIKDVSIQSATISLGADLGQRATVTITFRDHRHIFNGEDFDSGTFWGKFRARYGLTIAGNPFRLIRGTLGQELDDMETRHFVVESTEGPTNDGDYQIVAKDIFSFVKGDRAQAPPLSSGFLFADISAGAVTMQLLPANVEDEYPTIAGTSPPHGYMAIGGTEIVTFVPLGGDQFGLARGQFNTTAVAHSAGDRVQLVLFYDDADPADIIYDLLVNYANVDPEFIPLTDWQLETSTYLGSTYTAVISEPHPVDELISELIEQAALALWWDDISQNIRLQVLKQISTTTAIFDQANTLVGTLEVAEQPDKRISHVQVYFGKVNPLINDDQEDNYSHSLNSSDDTAILEYGTAVFKKILSRWIPEDGRTVAETLATKQLGRFRDPPRRVKFQTLRDDVTIPQLGGGYLLGGTQFQTTTGEPDQIDIQITRLNPYADRFEIEAEEMLWTPFEVETGPYTRNMTFANDRYNLNLRDEYDLLYPEPDYPAIAAGDTVNIIIASTAEIRSHSIATPAVNVGIWPAITINLIVNGLIVGCGGDGGNGAYVTSVAPPTTVAATNGENGGVALFTVNQINLTSTNGAIWGGGGGGGGGGITSPPLANGNGGGGGAGSDPGAGGIGGIGVTGTAGNDGGVGSLSLGGSPNGGAAGQAGTAGVTGATVGGSGGSGGAAIDGDSFVVDIGAVGDIRGSRIN